MSEATTSLSSVTLETARAITRAAQEEASKAGDHICVVVLNRLGMLLAAESSERVPAASFEVALAKATHSIRFHRPTSYQDDLLTNGTLQVLAVPGMLPLAGGIPLEMEGELVGSVGVSGVASVRDEEIAHAGAAALAQGGQPGGA
jgi:glc operon protein GlcG